jgi:hypothetical protein
MAKKVKKGNKGQGKKAGSGKASGKKPVKTAKPGSKKGAIPGEGIGNY